MPFFDVALTGSYTETYRVQADTPEQAEALVRKGDGNFRIGDWNETPSAEVKPCP